MLDCIIIGSGIAGISAALTLKANGKSFILLGSPDLSEKIEKAENIRNYAGVSKTTGKALVAALKNQLADEEIAVTAEKASGVYKLKDKFTVATQEGGVYDALSVILACGVESVKSIDGEQEFLGRGVSYCATCDGFLYKGKTIAVLCTSKRLEHEIRHLSSFAQKVYLIPIYKDVAKQAENVEIIQKMPDKIVGDKRVAGLQFKEGVLAVDGVFMLRESYAPSILVGGLETDGAHVVVSRQMETNLEGCFAAGDCTGRPYQYAKAAGEGNVAAHAVTQYVNKINK